MKVSSKLRYGLFLMAELAHAHKDKLIQIKGFAEKQGLSYKYLEQVVIELRTHKLIDSVRGPKGGYQLTKNPSDITLYDIFYATQGPLNKAKCKESLSEEGCENAHRCLTMNLWGLLEESIREKLEKTSLEEFLKTTPEFRDVKCVTT